MTTEFTLRPAAVIRDEPAFVLRTWPWHETSLMVEVFTRGHGRQILCARGAKRPASLFRGLLSPFCLLRLDYRGEEEVKRLLRARWQGALSLPGGKRLLSGFYLNELLSHLTAPGDPAPDLFEVYALTLRTLSLGEGMERALREFEVDLLRLCGWGQYQLEQPPAAAYVAREGRLAPLPEPLPSEAGEPSFAPAVARAIVRRDFSDEAVLGPARVALRQLIDYYVAGEGLAVRRLTRAWRQL